MKVGKIMKNLQWNIQIMMVLKEKRISSSIWLRLKCTKCRIVRDGGMDIKLKKIIRLRVKKNWLTYLSRFWKHHTVLSQMMGEDWLREELTQEFMGSRYILIFIWNLQRCKLLCWFYQRNYAYLEQKSRLSMKKSWMKILASQARQQSNDQVANVNTQNFLNGNHW